MARSSRWVKGSLFVALPILALACGEDSPIPLGGGGAGTGAEGGAGGGEPTAGGGGSDSCGEAGTTKACYSGPSETKDVGACKAGTSTCGLDGAWGSCVGEVLPNTGGENCALPDSDDNCNGADDATDGCECVPRTQADCYTGPEGTLGVGICASGKKMCSDDGLSYGACIGQTLPATETCDETLNVDNDCDGSVGELDDDDDTCDCVFEQTKNCFSGPGIADVGICVHGTQTCAQNGEWGDCEGEIVSQGIEVCDAGGLDEDCNGQVNDTAGQVGADPSCVCHPDEVASCYEGPDNTLLKGICVAGEKTCAADGSAWGDCVGDVLPLADEDCSTPEDDNCNGVANATCPCPLVGATEACYGGAVGTEGVGVCTGGTRTCEAITGWSACVGEVLPSTENCNTAPDEDCDGETPACNDTCGGAEVVAFTALNQTKNISGSLALGTSDYSNDGCSTEAAKEVYYEVQVPAEGKLVFTVTGELYALGRMSPCGTGTYLQCKTPLVEAGSTKTITLNAPAGTYYFEVSGTTPGTVGSEGAFTGTAVLTAPVCGDGVISGVEQCDDGNTVDDQACMSDCTDPPPDASETCPGTPFTVAAGTSFLGTDADPNTTNGYVDDYAPVSSNGDCEISAFVAGAPDRVHRIKPTSAGTLTITAGLTETGTYYCNDVGFDPDLCYDQMMYLRTSCASVNPVDEIECNGGDQAVLDEIDPVAYNGFGGYGVSRMVFNVVNGTADTTANPPELKVNQEYFLFVDSENHPSGSDGNYVLTFNLTP